MTRHCGVQASQIALLCIWAAWVFVPAARAHEEIPGAGSQNFTRVLDGKNGKYQLKLMYSPSFPTAGQITNIDFSVVRLLAEPDPLLGSEIPVTQPPDAMLVATNSGKVVDAHLPVHQEGGAGEYGIAEYKFPKGGSFFLRIVVHGDNGDVVTTDFPVTVKADEAALFRLWVNLGLGIFIVGLTAMQLARARARGTSGTAMLRPAAIGLVCLILVVLVMDRLVLGPVLDLRKPKVSSGASSPVSVNDEGGFVIPVDAQKQLGMSVVEAKEVPMEHSLTAVGKVEARPDLTAVVQAPLWGRIEWAFDKPLSVGDTVRKNQVLVNVVLELSAVERGPMEQKNLDIKGVLQRARERKESLQAEYERLQKLAAANPAYEQDVKWAKELRDEAAIIYDEINRQDKQFSGPGGTMQFRDPRRTPVASPMNGVIASINFTPGELNPTNEFKTLFTIVDTKSVWVRAEVYVNDLWNLREGQPVQVFPASNSSKPVSGVIHYIGDTLNPANRTVPVLVEVSNEGGVFAIGSFAKLEFQHRQKAVAVPEEAVIDTGIDRWVYVEGENQTFAAVPVEVGNRQNGWWQILSGLRPGDRVIAKGAALLGSMPRQAGAASPAENVVSSMPGPSVASAQTAVAQHD